MFGKGALAGFTLYVNAANPLIDMISTTLTSPTANPHIISLALNALLNNALLIHLPVLDEKTVQDIFSSFNKLIGAFIRQVNMKSQDDPQEKSKQLLSPVINKSSISH